MIYLLPFTIPMLHFFISVLKEILFPCKHIIVGSQLRNCVFASLCHQYYPSIIHRYNVIFFITFFLVIFAWFILCSNCLLLFMFLSFCLWLSFLLLQNFSLLRAKLTLTIAQHTTRSL
ncbi:expressed protein [Phakopsora pachyrhizi]|uniref:Expressed protein n=1 Tax=Phakopsora pachyrhizi TaxID=170000 RepID=A0AAV0BS06_PHAPC|nr:expressed protein [Phakopsora pachyrhizi]